MDNFIRDENLKLYRKALLESSDEEQRRVLQLLLRLLLDEQKPSPSVLAKSVPIAPE